MRQALPRLCPGFAQAQEHMIRVNTLDPCTRLCPGFARLFLLVFIFLCAKQPHGQEVAWLIAAGKMRSESTNV